jgi:hypothetical protein
MTSGRESLEVGYRVSSIRKVKKYLYIVQILITLVFASYLMLAGGGFSLKPFYLSINSFIYFVILMLLIIGIESFVFMWLEMRFIKSDSAKRIMTKGQIRRAIYVIGVCAIVIFILWAPFVTKGMENAMTSKGSVQAISNDFPQIRTFYNNDPLGLTSTNTMTFNSNGAATVYILSEASYLLFRESGKGVLAQYRVNTLNYEIANDLSLTFPELSFSKYYILVYSDSGGLVDVTFTVSNTISPTLYSFVPLFALFFIIAYGSWAAFLVMTSRGLNKKTVAYQ